MQATRRQVLLQGGVIGAGLIASGLSSRAALAAASSPPPRRSLHGLAWNDPIIETYRDGVGIMKRLPTSNQFNWVTLSKIHGDIKAGFHFCPHGDWYFLPWHRAFTAMYERIVRHLTKNDDFALPFWDWTSNPVMPEVFLPKQTPGGKTNWLCVDEEGMRRTWPATKAMPDTVVGPAVLAEILKASPFEIFGTSRPDGQDSLDLSWVSGGGGVQGTLEGVSHNLVHNNIGGWMPTASSPRDPIFFMHHGNIDRIWALWRTHHPDSDDKLWTDMVFTDNFVNVDGTMWSPKVSELLQPESLGYTYGLEAPVATAQAVGPRTLSLNQKLSTIFAKPRALALVEGVTTVSEDNARTATATRPLSVALTLPNGTLAALARRPSTAAGLDTMDFSAAREQAASGPRALAVLRNVAITDPSTTMIRVFLGGAPVAQGTPTDDPRYIGTFGVLDHGMGHDGHAHAAPSFVVDLTDAIGRVYGNALPASGAVDLQLLPVPIERPGALVGTATPERVEIVVASG